MCFVSCVEYVKKMSENYMGLGRGEERVEE